jgi:signal transduction histidine kinase
VPVALEQTIQGLEQISRIVRSMKEFAHPGPEGKTPTDLNRAIENTITVARNEWKYVAEMHLDLDPDLPLVECNPGEFNQVVLNLVVNAAQALAESIEREGLGKGNITVSSRRDGDWAEIRVGDDGPGIPQGLRDRIFEPFFTTKEPGKGTGQGLAIAHAAIVKNQQGTISLETAPGKGATFIIRLPIGPRNI